MVLQGVQLGSALKKEDAEHVADSVAQLAALKMMPKSTFSFKRQRDTLSWRSATRTGSHGRRSAGPRAQVLGGRARRQRQLERPIELSYRESPVLLGTALRLYVTHAATAAWKGRVRNHLGAAVLGACSRSRGSVKINGKGEITGAGATGHSNVLGMPFALGGRLAGSTSRRMDHARPAVHLAGRRAAARPDHLGPRGLGHHEQPQRGGLLLGRPRRESGHLRRDGRGVESVFGNMRENARDYFSRTSKPPRTAARTAAFGEYLQGVEGNLRAQSPELFGK